MNYSVFCVWVQRVPKLDQIPPLLFPETCRTLSLYICHDAPNLRPCDRGITARKQFLTVVVPLYLPLSNLSSATTALLGLKISNFREPPLVSPQSRSIVLVGPHLPHRSTSAEADISIKSDRVLLIYNTLFDLNNIRPLIQLSIGIQSLLKRETVKHNVIDRDKILISPNWGSWGKIRILREGFEMEIRRQHLVNRDPISSGSGL